MPRRATQRRIHQVSGTDDATRASQGLLGGVLIAGLRFIEYRWLIVEHSIEIYGGLVAAVFAAVGIWLGQRLTRPAETAVRFGVGRTATPWRKAA